MNRDTRNLSHKNDAELDKCECTDKHCSSCRGTCRNPAAVTMYDTTQPEENQTGVRMCLYCAVELFETTDGEWQSDYDRNPDEQPE